MHELRTHIVHSARTPFLPDIAVLKSVVLLLSNPEVDAPLPISHWSRLVKGTAHLSHPPVVLEQVSSELE